VLLAEVQADDQAGVVIDLEEDGRLAAGRGAPSDLADDAVVEEARDDVADGGPGEPGQARNVGPADRPEVIERADDKPLIVDAGLLVGRLGRERHRPGRASSPADPAVLLADFVQSMDKVIHPGCFVKSVDKDRGPASGSTSGICSLRPPGFGSADVASSRGSDRRRNARFRAFSRLPADATSNLCSEL